MIATKKDLREYLSCDAKNFPLENEWWGKRVMNHLFSNPISDQKYIWKYIYTLRHVEYHFNNKGIYHILMSLYYRWLLREYSYKTGFQIPPNTCGKGLTIWHWGPIIINSKCKLGENCTLYPMVLIGHKSTCSPAPVLGDNVFVGAGSKIIGDIRIGNNVVIGQNVTIVKNIPDKTIIVNPSARLIN